MKGRARIVQKNWQSEWIDATSDMAENLFDISGPGITIEWEKGKFPRYKQLHLADFSRR